MSRLLCLTELLRRLPGQQRTAARRLGAPEAQLAYREPPLDRAAWASEARSTVTFDIEDQGPDLVKLTVRHDGFDAGSAVLAGINQGWPRVLALAGINQGWPRVLADLKTLLETGDVPATA